MFKLLLGSFLTLNPAPLAPANADIWNNPPKANLHLNAVREIFCGFGAGTANYIDPRGILVTAYHVVDDSNGKCIDAKSGQVYKVYYQNKDLDIALLHGEFNNDKRFIKAKCSGMVKGRKYLSVGWVRGDLRMDEITFTGEHQHQFDFGYAKPYYKTPFAVSEGVLVPGMSGGTVIDLEDWSMVGINNISTAWSKSYTRELKDTVLCKR